MRKQPKANEGDSSEEFQNFAQLTKKLVSVSNAEVRERMSEEKRKKQPREKREK